MAANERRPAAKAPPRLSPLALAALAAVAACAAMSAQAAGGDPATWTCETCPFPKPATQASVDVGVAHVSDASAAAGDYTGLRKRGATAVLGGEVRHRDASGTYADLLATDLGLDVRALSGRFGREGRFDIRLGYAEIDHRVSDRARTPFIGAGTGTQTLPAGFPQADTAAMPLATTLQPAELGIQRTRFSLGGTLPIAREWTASVQWQREQRDGTQRLGGSFFSTASQLVAPVDQVSDSLELAAAWRRGAWQASLAWQLAQFRNAAGTLTWSNPFTPVVAGADRGQLALAPDNQFQQLVASLAYQVSPTLHASGDIAWGRMTQDAAFVAPTLNASLAASVPALPAASLDGQVDTFSAHARVAAQLRPDVRLSASYTRDVRDNRTSSLAMPVVSTDLFLATTPRNTRPYSFTRDLLRVQLDARAPLGIRLSAGVDQDERSRTLQEVVDTAETTAWVRATARPHARVGLSLRVAHGQRRHSDYGVLVDLVPPENPLLRKYNLAARERSVLGARADFTPAEGVTIGLSAEGTNDRYTQSTIGLTAGRGQSLGADASAAIDDRTQVHAYVQEDRTRSTQAGADAATASSWVAWNRDTVQVLGLGLKHQALKGKLELAADATVVRTRGRVAIDAGAASPPFPDIVSDRDAVQLSARYRLQDNLSLWAGVGVERYRLRDWHVDGVLPDTLANLLALGDAPPDQTVQVVRIGLRHRF